MLLLYPLVGPILFNTGSSSPILFSADRGANSSKPDVLMIKVFRSGLCSAAVIDPSKHQSSLMQTNSLAYLPGIARESSIDCATCCNECARRLRAGGRMTKERCLRVCRQIPPPHDEQTI